MEDIIDVEDTFDPNTSVLEDFLESLTNIPPELKRTTSLLREVDARCVKDQEMLKKAQDDHLDAVTKKASNAAQLGVQVQQHKKRLDTRMAEKTVLVEQLFDIMKKHTIRLDRDIKNIQGLLADTGELDESGVPDPFAQSDATPSTRISTQIPKSVSTTTPATAQSQTPGLAGTGTPAISQRRASQGPAGNAPISAADVSRLIVGSDVAAKNEENLWILARIAEVNAPAGLITIADADNGKESVVSFKSLQVLIDNEDVAHARTRIGSGRNRIVMALYPETTAFYEATMVQNPFRCSPNDPDPNLAGKVCVGCMFNDDADATGVTPKRIVSVKYVFPV